METRSNQVLVGSVVLILLAATAIFTVWLARLGGGVEKNYDIFFKQSVDGLAKGSAVSFSGVPSGQVTEIKLWQPDPQFVRVRIAVKEEVPILDGTTATIQGVGFTGVSQIQLDGAMKGAKPITEIGPGGVPVIPTKPGALGELLNSAPKLLERLSTLTERLTEVLSDENQKSIAGILKNADRLSGSLADRGPEIAATLAETRIAIRQAGTAAEQIGKLAGTTNDLLDKEGRPLVGDLREAVAAAKKSMENLDGAITAARPGIDNFSRRTLPEVGQLVRDLREMSEALTAVAGRLDRGGAGSLIGSQKLPDYEPGKGDRK
ncbi:phospholipid/cholesterol/gamma-HCH transport system substrate-binding protein [Sphingomonas zeicaulis]|uniref:MlaD family protein n=1 Tax=Sphingomonas zeicaulis TaxID=1632740 RepID=UPI003D19BE01